MTVQITYLKMSNITRVFIRKDFRLVIFAWRLLRREAFATGSFSRCPLHLGPFAELRQDTEKENIKQTMSMENPFSQESVAPGFVARGTLWRGTFSWRFRCAATKVHVILRFVHPYMLRDLVRVIYIFLMRVGLTCMFFGFGTDAAPPPFPPRILTQIFNLILSIWCLAASAEEYRMSTLVN